MSDEQTPLEKHTVMIVFANKNVAAGGYVDPLWQTISDVARYAAALLLRIAELEERLRFCEFVPAPGQELEREWQEPTPEQRAWQAEAESEAGDGD